MKQRIGHLEVRIAAALGELVTILGHPLVVKEKDLEQAIRRATFYLSQPDTDLSEHANSVEESIRKVEQWISENPSG